MLLESKLSNVYRTEDEKRKSFGQQSYLERTKWFIRVVTLKGRVAALEVPQFESLVLAPDCGDSLLGEALLLAFSRSCFSR